MDIAKIKEMTRKMEITARKERKKKYYIATIAWFKYLGLLRHNEIEKKRSIVTLQEALKAGQLEPRIYELLPALLVAIPNALKQNEDKMPNDLALVIDEIKSRRATTVFRGVPPDKYLNWLNSPALDQARKRFEFRLMPRKSKVKSSEIGEFVRANRMLCNMTQKELAQTYGISLRVLRDIEQGKLGASIGNVNDILCVFNSSLQIG